MAKVKAVNYTAEQVEVLKARYTGADNVTEVAEIATELGKTPASVRAKLSSLKLYKTSEKTETGADRVTKRMIVEAIAVETGLSEAETEGLEKATKSALDKVLAKLVS